MHDLLTKRSTNERSFSRSYKQLQQLLLNDKTLANTIERHLQLITDQWNAIQEYHDLYAVTCLADEADIAAHDLWIDPYYAKFVDIASQCDSFLLNAKMPFTSTSAVNAIKLEKLKFRTFDGDARKYLKFKAEFNKFVRPLCEDSQITFVLKSHLCESVVRDVEHIDHDINLMWERLDNKYGNLRKIIDCILKDLKTLPINSAISRSSIELINVIESAYHDLNTINALDEMMNSTVLSVIERAMPLEMRDEWIKIVVTDHSKRADELLPFLLDWRSRIEYWESDIRTDCKSASPSTTPLLSAPTRRCLIHHNCEHPVWRCRVFRSLPVQRRLEIVKSLNACQLCLDVGHDIERCPKTFACSSGGCTAKHNRLLHMPS